MNIFCVGISQSSASTKAGERGGRGERKPRATQTLRKILVQFNRIFGSQENTLKIMAHRRIKGPCFFVTFGLRGSWVSEPLGLGLWALIGTKLLNYGFLEVPGCQATGPSRGQVFVIRACCGCISFGYRTSAGNYWQWYPELQGLPRRRVFGLWTPTAPHSPQSAGLGYRVFQGAGLSDYETSVVLGVWATGLVLCIPR